MKAYIDIEKSDGKFNFCESLVQDITINKKDSFNSQFFLHDKINDKKIISKSEEFFEILFKKNIKFQYPEYMNSIEDVFVEFQNNDSFKIYFEMMKIIENIDYDLLKNLLFHFHIKDLENKNIE